MNHTYIEFTITFFHKLNLVTNVVNINDIIPDDLDLGLRRSVIGEGSERIADLKFSVRLIL